MRSRMLTSLTVLSIVLAVGEFISAVIIAVENYRDSLPAAGVVFGVLFLIGTWLLRTRRVTAGTVLVGILCLFEVVSFPGWQRHNGLDWAFQTVDVVLALAGLATAVGLFVARRRSPAMTA